MVIFIAPLFATSCNETSRCPDDQIFDAPGGHATRYCEGTFNLNGIIDGRTNRDINFM